MINRHDIEDLSQDSQDDIEPIMESIIAPIYICQGDSDEITMPRYVSPLLSEPVLLVPPHAGRCVRMEFITNKDIDDFFTILKKRREERVVTETILKE